MSPLRVSWMRLLGILASLPLPGRVFSQSAVYTLHSDSSCSTPTIIGFQESPPPSCSAITTCSSVNVNGEDLYWNRACASGEYSALSASAYGDKPYVLMEIYDSSAECGKLLSGAAFLADGSCLATDNGASSVRVSLWTDGSATFVTYRGVSCIDAAIKTTTVTKASITSHSCENGALKFYSSNATKATATVPPSTDKSISTTTSQSAPHFLASAALLAFTTTVAATLI
ncbi:hypothetical protein P3T76_002156 [Phytophthora citrophthora]|uniref:Uncharacterized protein n=1 Tax=Phytophthora citrophthora TaxID=4793 RepID=A0AAD9GWY5_9STRA|nr:hypothetical protein P3T76_002156 [Phytophthora citrophthora]